MIYAYNNIVKVLRLNRYSYSLNLQSMFGDTAALSCCINGNTEILQWLIDNGANIELSNIYCKTPLHFAVDYRNLDCIKILQKYDVNIDAQCNKGNIALF